MEAGGSVEAISHVVELHRTLAGSEEQWKQATHFGRTWRAFLQSAVDPLLDRDLEVLPPLLLPDHAHGHPVHRVRVVLQMDIESS